MIAGSSSGGRTTRSGRSATLGAVSDVFSTTEQAKEKVAVEKGTVRLYINGRDHGAAAIEGRTIGDFVKDYARSAGIRSFSVYLDGAKAYTDVMNKKFGKVSKVELVAKDARGAERQ